MTSTRRTIAVVTFDVVGQDSKGEVVTDFLQQVNNFSLSQIGHEALIDVTLDCVCVANVIRFCSIQVLSIHSLCDLQCVAASSGQQVDFLHIDGSSRLFAGIFHIPVVWA